MKRTRKTAGEWRQILEAQRARGLTNLATAAEFGVSVASLGNWKKRQIDDGSRRSVGMVEVTSLMSAGVVLRVHLSNGIRIDAPPSWPLEHLGRVAKVLGSL